jgi:hypothetical protein
MQVPAKLGWVFVNPYMTLVVSYERLIGARGTEIKDGDTAPPIAGIPPVIMRPSDIPAVALAPVAHTEESAVRAKSHKAKAKPAKKRSAKATKKKRRRG